jgi:hypothetical protein
MLSHFQENFKSPANASLHVQGQAPILLVPWGPAVQRAEMHSMFSIQRRYMFFIIVLSHRVPIRHQEADTSSAEDSPEYSHQRDGRMRCAFKCAVAKPLKNILSTISVRKLRIEK